MDLWNTQGEITIQICFPITFGFETNKLPSRVNLSVYQYTPSRDYYHLLGTIVIPPGSKLIATDETGILFTTLGTIAIPPWSELIAKNGIPLHWLRNICVTEPHWSDIYDKISD